MPDVFVLRLEASGEVTPAQPEEPPEVEAVLQAEAEPEEEQ